MQNHSKVRYPLRDDGDIQIPVICGGNAVNFDKQAHCHVCEGCMVNTGGPVHQREE